jgi:hypothetical protein
MMRIILDCCGMRIVQIKGTFHVSMVKARSIRLSDIDLL